jgi:acetyl-CoA synthetase
MVPEAAVAMLACARLGAVHSVVFAGFSAEALRERLQNAEAKVLITADEGRRGGKHVPLKMLADEALLAAPLVQRCLVYRHTGARVPWHPSRDLDLREAMQQARPYCPAEPVDAEDPLFLLYTSGSTGAPKGLLHTTGGYLLYAALTHRYVFDWHPGDRYACVADVGWITGHTYIVYGPLCNGASTFMFESLPTYPDAGRYWDLVQRHRLTHFYTAPTALRTLMAQGDEPVRRYDRSSLRVLGSVGEPINPEAWRWYHDVVGEGRCALVDTYWQTETGGVVIAPLPGAVRTKPGAATLPFFGIEPVLLDAASGRELQGPASGLLAFRRSWPGIARSVFGDHARYLKTYLQPYPGFYFTGDGATRDEDGYLWITGRVDDVINKAGHRLGSAEIESALVNHPACAEAAVIGVADPIKGEAIWAFVTLREGYSEKEKTLQDLRLEVRRRIGAIAAPDQVIVTPNLPKTRSGKIMRRLLRKLAQGETRDFGDTSTLADPAVVELLIQKVRDLHK